MVLLGLSCVLTQCGGSSKSSSTPTVASIAISPASPSIAVGATQQFTATAKDSSGNTISGVTFAWSSSAAGVATINSSGLATGVSAGTTQITASSGGVTSPADTLTVTPPPVASIAISPASPSIAVGATQQFTATAKDSSGNTISGVTFAWSSSATGVATINSSGLATGVSAGTTQITASSGGVTSPADTLTVTPCAGGSEGLMNGSYVFLLKGFDGSGNPALVAGALTFDGAGTITTGTMDANLNSGVVSNLAVTSGIYRVGSDHRGCMVITTASGVQNYRFSLGSISAGVASAGHMIDFDPGGPFTTGILRKQSGGPFSNASMNGNYAFGGSSIQNAAVCASPCKFGIIGVIDFDGSGGISGGSEDVNQNGVVDGSASNTTWPSTPIPIDGSPSSVYSVTANGRVSSRVSYDGGAGVSNTILYLVSPGEAFFLSADPQTTANISAGTALLQSGTPFAANPLSGTYVGYDSGTAGMTGVARTDLYLLGPLTSGNSALAGVQYRNTGGTFNSGSLAGGTYSVSPIGRSILSGGGGHAPLLYLVSTSQAFFLQSNLSVDSGFFQLQSGGPFSNSFASGSFAVGYIDPELPSVGAVSGVAVAASASNSLSITLDAEVSGVSYVDVPQTSTYSIDSTGLGLEPMGCSVTATPITCDSALYLISPTSVVTMDLQRPDPVITTGQQ
jgi:hypothetical protein